MEEQASITLIRHPCSRGISFKLGSCCARAGMLLHLGVLALGVTSRNKDTA